MPYCLLYSTHPDTAQAEATARSLLAEQLVACCNVLPGMRAIYRWEGAIQHAEECVLLSKTTALLAAAAMTRIAQLHPYDCPAVLQLPVTAGHAPYLGWLDGQIASE